MTGAGVEFDQATGRLRLSTDQFTTLVEHTGPAEQAPELAAAGALTAAGAHPLLKPGLAAVRAPVCHLEIRVAGAAATHLHQGWVAAEAAGFLVFVRDETYEFLTVGPTFAPLAVARILRLQPRPPLAIEPFTAPADTVDELLAADTSAREKAVAVMLDAAPKSATGWARAITDGGWRAGHVAATWLGPDGTPSGRDLAVLDSPAGTLHAHRPDDLGDDPGDGLGDATVSWAPTTTSALWPAVVALLPDDEELAHPSATSAAPA